MTSDRGRMISLQERVDDAWEKMDIYEYACAADLAQQALEAHPNAIDAYVVLAQTCGVAVERKARHIFGALPELRPALAIPYGIERITGGFGDGGGKATGRSIRTCEH